MTLEVPPEGGNQAPTCTDATFTTNKNEPVTLPAGGCTDPDGDPVTIEVVDGPDHGTLSDGSGGTTIYTPDDDFVGTDSFTYGATDSHGTASEEATVTINVQQPNRAPVCQGKSVNVDFNTAKTFTLVCTDADGDTLDLSKVTDPAKGTLSAINDASGAVTYTPNSGATGSDTFTFKANDGTADSNTATVTLTIADPPNQAPACQDVSVTVPAGETTNIDVSCTDPDGDPWSASKSDDPGHGSVAVVDQDTFAYTPATGYFGPDTFTYRGFDGADFGTDATVTITVVRNIASDVVAPGATLSTGTTADDDAPVVTGVTLPPTTGGAVTIAETPVVGSAPSGFTFIGQQVDITAPAASGPEQPLQLVFEVAASALPAGTTAANLEVFRNGTRVPACTGPAGHAVPSPCVSNRETIGNGNARITVLTVAASRWNFGKANPTTNPGTNPNPDPGTSPDPDPGTSPDPGTNPGPGPETPRDQQPDQGQTGQGQPQGQGGGSSTAADTRAPAGSFAVVAKQTIRKLIAKGLKLTVRCDEACSTRVELMLDKKTAKKLKLKTALARANAKVPANGSKKVTVKVPKAAKKKLKKLRAVTLTVRVTATDSSGNTSLTKRKLKLKR
jgi:hypothetical protein